MLHNFDTIQTRMWLLSQNRDFYSELLSCFCLARPCQTISCGEQELDAMNRSSVKATKHIHLSILVWRGSENNNFVQTHVQQISKDNGNICNQSVLISYNT